MQERSKRGRGMVSEHRFLISAFLKDVLNEITTFAASEGAQGGSKSLQSLPGRIRNQFQTLLNSCFDALAGGPGRSTPGFFGTFGTKKYEKRRRNGAISPFPKASNGEISSFLRRFWAQVAKAP